MHFPLNYFHKLSLSFCQVCLNSLAVKFLPNTIVVAQYMLAHEVGECIFQHGSFDELLRGIGESLARTSSILGYRSPRHTALLSTDPLSVSAQMSVPDMPPGARGRHMDWLPAKFLKLVPVSSRQGK